MSTSPEVLAARAQRRADREARREAARKAKGTPEGGQFGAQPHRAPAAALYGDDPSTEREAYDELYGIVRSLVRRRRATQASMYKWDAATSDDVTSETIAQFLRSARDTHEKAGLHGRAISLRRALDEHGGQIGIVFNSVAQWHTFERGKYSDKDINAWRQLREAEEAHLTAHGRPFTNVERNAAAERITASFPPGRRPRRDWHLTTPNMSFDQSVGQDEGRERTLGDTVLSPSADAAYARVERTAYADQWPAEDALAWELLAREQAQRGRELTAEERDEAAARIAARFPVHRQPRKGWHQRRDGPYAVAHAPFETADFASAERAQRSVDRLEAWHAETQRRHEARRNAAARAGRRAPAGHRAPRSDFGLTRAEAWNAVSPVAGAPAAEPGALAAHRREAAAGLIAERGGVVAILRRADRGQARSDELDALYAPWPRIDARGERRVAALLAAHPELAEGLWKSASAIASRSPGKRGEP